MNEHDKQSQTSGSDTLSEIKRENNILNVFLGIRKMNDEDLLLVSKRVFSQLEQNREKQKEKERAEESFRQRIVNIVYNDILNGGTLSQIVLK